MDGRSRSKYDNREDEIMSLVEKETAKAVFAAYTDHYNSKDPKIKLKIDHTYRVAELCEKIAESVGMEEADIRLAWLCGLLHDVGRFEQIRRYNTFSDADSVDHAKLSCEILFGEEKRIREYCKEDCYDTLIETAVGWHSAYRLPDELDDRTRAFCNILRDADKIDILRVNLDTPMEQIYNVTSEELYAGTISPAVMQAFDGHHTVLRALKKTAVDHAVGHICLAYELVYPKSRQLIKEQGYLEKLMQFPTRNPETKKQFCHIREEMHRFLEEE